jgi:methenyltetrahydrofolate cyclohydrolase
MTYTPAARYPCIIGPGHLSVARTMTSTSMADLRISEFVEGISSDKISPGAGAAGAVALALGAACAQKAVSISLKHSPHDSRLAKALADLEKVRNCALQDAEADSQEFADFIRHRTASGARELVETGEAMAHLIDALLVIIEDVEAHVRPSMKSDLIAAKSLAAAARTIQSTNEAEAKDEQRAIAEHQGEAK